MCCGCLGEGSRRIGEKDDWLAVFGGDVEFYGWPSAPITRTGSTSPTFHIGSVAPDAGAGRRIRRRPALLGARWNTSPLTLMLQGYVPHRPAATWLECGAV